MLKQLFISILSLLSFNTLAQFAFETDPHRGMYVDNFVKTNLYNASVFDQTFSVLGVDVNHDGIFEKEDAVLKYAADNHITYLALFDLHRIFGRHLIAWDENQFRYLDLEDHLERFIIKAKTRYGISQVGAIGGSTNFFDSLNTYLIRHPSVDFDVLNVEFEFWLDCPNEFQNFVDIMSAMDSLKSRYNPLHPGNGFITEAYLAALYRCNSSFGALQVVETIDGCVACSPCSTCSNPHTKLADRVLYAWYITDPGSMDFSEQNIFENAASEDSTDFHPIIYAESISTGGSVNWTGAWFPLSPTHNIFTAEESYYTTWRNNTSVAFLTPRQNNVQAGGVHWFTASNMVGYRDHPSILQNTGPYCTNAADQLVDFLYYGPIEAGINFEFWVTRDNDSSLVYPTPGGRVHGGSGIYQPAMPTSPMIKNINFQDQFTFRPCRLPAGNYTSHLLLNYDNGTGRSYQSDYPVIIDSMPRLSIIGPSEFCSGRYTYIHVNSNGGTISWYRNGELLPGTNPDLYVTADGDYSCTLTGSIGCSPNSDTIHVHVLPNPSIALNSVCNGNGTATIKADMLPVNTGSASSSGQGGLLYKWNTGATSSQITVTPPSSNTTYRVLVTDPYSGCTSSSQLTLKSPLQSPFGSSITVNQQPSSPCTSDGSITANIFAGGGPNNFLWSNGETTQTISGLSPGTYIVAMNVWAGGCTTYDTVTIGSAPGNAPVVLEVLNNVTCSGDSDGSIRLNITGGSPPFDFSWSYLPDASLHDPNAKDQASLFPGTYTVIIHDVLNCLYTYSYKIDYINPAPYFVSVASTATTGCAPGLNGTSSVQVGGGSPPYTYEWNDPLQQSTQSATGLSAGSWIVEVTDALGCKADTFVSVGSSEIPVVAEIQNSSRSEESCPGAQDGRVEIAISGGSPPYSVSSPWILSADNASLENLSPGSYPVLISDANGCTFADTFNIYSQEPLQLYTVSFPTSCIGCHDGYVELTYGGGSPSYLFSITPNTGLLLPNRLKNLPAGIYSICLIDQNACSLCVTDTILEDPSGFYDIDINRFIKVYPNPVTNIVTIESSNLDGYNKIEIRNISGGFVLTHEINTIGILLINIEFSPGVYFLRLYNEKNEAAKGAVKMVVMGGE